MNRRTLLSVIVTLPSAALAGALGPPSEDEEPLPPPPSKRVATCDPLGDLTVLSQETLMEERRCAAEAIRAYDTEIARRAKLFEAFPP